MGAAQNFLQGYLDQLADKPGRTAALTAVPFGVAAVGAYGAAQRQQDPSGMMSQQYSQANQYDRMAMSPQQQLDAVDRRARSDSQFQMGLAQEMGRFNRGIGRDLLRQEGDQARALQGQSLRSNEAQNLLNQYTQRLANNQNFFSSLMSGTRYS
ncbi:MAG: hypothetical protein AAGA83_00390 [Cyanobacteria bacterium P01_F01_bin.116]